MIRLGCSQWNYSFLKIQSDAGSSETQSVLSKYSRRFNCVELNSTFYDEVPPQRFLKWKTQTGEDFRFCPKFPAAVSHERRLIKTEDLSDRFVTSVSQLGEKLGITFLQLPLYFDKEGVSDIEKFLIHIANRIRVSVEFRSDWIENRELMMRCLKILHEHDTGIVITDGAETAGMLNNLKLTNRSAMIRFLTYNHPTDFERVNDWINLISEWQSKGLDEIYFMIHFSDQETEPEIVTYTRKRFAGDLGLECDQD